LFNTFSTVLVLDSTYKTNKYRLPLLEFVGNTSTMKIFYIAFAYMMCEKQYNVYWALGRCNIPHVSNGILPVKRVRELMFMENTYDGKCLLRDVS
jgi:hypothetical protein